MAGVWMHLPSKYSILCIPLQGCTQREGVFVLSRMLHYGPGTTLLEMEVGVVFNPYLEQLSLQTTKPLCIRRVKKAKSSTGGCSHKYTSRGASQMVERRRFPSRCKGDGAGSSVREVTWHYWTKKQDWKKTLSSAQTDSSWYWFNVSQSRQTHPMSGLIQV